MTRIWMTLEWLLPRPKRMDVMRSATALAALISWPIAQVDMVIFDKTGTLTLGNMQRASIHPARCRRLGGRGAAVVCCYI